MPGASVWTPPEGRAPSNPRARNVRPEISTPGPLLPDSARAECERGGPTPPEPRCAWSRVSQIGVLGPFGPLCAGWQGYPPG